MSVKHAISSAFFITFFLGLQYEAAPLDLHYIMLNSDTGLDKSDSIYPASNGVVQP